MKTSPGIPLHLGLDSPMWLENMQHIYSHGRNEGRIYCRSDGRRKDVKEDNHFHVKISKEKREEPFGLYISLVTHSLH
jgi:hypothetical protein